MPEPIDAWWARRQFSRGRAVPYEVGTYREVWAPFPVLISQYHPDLNRGIALTQIPPAAEVLLQWQCDAGHIFVATPQEQRTRPGRERRRSSWCPECAAVAKPRPIRPASPGAPPARRPPPAVDLCRETPNVPVGEPFLSRCAPKPASAVEAQLRQELADRLAFTHGLNAVRVRRPFFAHLEVWPDIVIPELRIAVEYDSTGRHGLEHVGKRETADRRKDRALRGARWEVVRIRTGRLQTLGPHDLQLSSINRRACDRILEKFREIRGVLFVDAYLR